MTTGVGAGVISGERFRSWADIQANAARGAGGLTALGLREDDSVALMLRNDFATFEADSVYRQRDAEGFINLNALRLKIRALRNRNA